MRPRSTFSMKLRVPAVELGQLPPGTDPMRLISTLIAPIYLSLLVTGQPS
jgi:hypothetical protein